MKYVKTMVTLADSHMKKTKFIYLFDSIFRSIDHPQVLKLNKNKIIFR